MDKFIIDHSKKNIIVDDNLHKLSKDLLPYIYKIEKLDKSIDNIKHVLSIEQVESEIPISNEYCSFCNTKCDCPKPGQQTYSFIWGYVKNISNAISLDELREINYENNLDSTIDYTSNVITLIDIIFPLIECIRKHYQYTHVYIHKIDSSEQYDIYIAP